MVRGKVEASVTLTKTTIMKKLFTLLSVFVLVVACKNEQKKDTEDQPEKMAKTEMKSEQKKDSSDINIDPISHATAVIKWGDAVIYLDPVGGAEAFSGKDKPSFVLVTDIHPDHMDAKTLQALKLEDTKVIVPQAVKEKLPQELQGNLMVMNNGDKKDFEGFSIEAIPMYNLPEKKDAYHTKGRGNGYVLEKNEKRLYIAGDTEDIPEMRNLRNIDVALIPMNLPYTMTVEDAAKGVLAFAPKKVYPYHYRGQDGLSDVQKFKELVNKGNKDIEVVQLDWYPDMD